MNTVFKYCDRIKFSPKRGVYKLYNKYGDIIYIGSSDNIEQRIISHKQRFGEEFDSYDYTEVSEKDRYITETIEIFKYNPKYNKSIPLQNRFITFPQLKQCLLEFNPSRAFRDKIHLTKLRKMVKNKGYSIYEYSNLEYIDVKNIDQLYLYVSSL